MMFSVVLLGGGILGLVWCFLAPPPFSVRISGPPAYHRNDPENSVYFGNGCFWHTQYDTVVVEQSSFSRGDIDVTSLVGYAGGLYESAAGLVCYHGLPHTDYGRLGHAEAVSVTLDPANSSGQMAELARVYFEDGFNDADGGRERKDPQDTGAAYRNVIGLPGGMDSALWPFVTAANTHGMPLVSGLGGPGDDCEDQFVVYIYDSIKFPFFRGETYHQFHKNDVVGRYVPQSYLSLSTVLSDAGKLEDSDCIELPFSELSFVIVLGFGLVTGVACAFPLALCPTPRCTQRVEPNEEKSDTLDRIDSESYS